MPTAVTHDIQVSVRTRFNESMSDPRGARFVFSYRITIANHSRETVQLLRRQWHIVDSLAPLREVTGPGVVGETPVLRPGASFTYTSACDLRSGLGRMQGKYLMQREHDGHRFEVMVPTFTLVFPWSLN